MHGFCSRVQQIDEERLRSLLKDEAGYVTYWVEGSLGCIRLNRPKALNAMTVGAD